MQKYFFIRENSRYVKINFSDIMYVEGCGNYLKIVTERKKYMALLALKHIELLLPAHLFARIHKSYIVSLDFITEFDRSNVYLKERKLPVGNQFRNVVERSVVVVQGDVFNNLSTVSINYLKQRTNVG
jgi:DNA-binding LytR/AlgR family response regulator